MMTADKPKYSWFFQSFRARTEHEVELYINELSSHLTDYELSGIETITNRFGGIIDVIVSFRKEHK